MLYFAVNRVLDARKKKNKMLLGSAGHLGVLDIIFEGYPRC